MNSPDSRLAVDLLRLTRRCRGIDKYVSSSAALTVDEMHFLSALYSEHPPSVKRLSEMVSISPSRTSKILKLLEQKGFVTRSIHPVDHRQEEVRLTEDGRRAVEAILSMFAEVGGALLGSWRKDVSNDFSWLLSSVAAKEKAHHDV